MELFFTKSIIFFCFLFVLLLKTPIFAKDF